MWAFSDVAPSCDQIANSLCLDLRIGHLSRNDMQRSFLQFVPGNHLANLASMDVHNMDVHIDTHVALHIYLHDTARFHVKKVSRNSISLVTVSTTKIQFFDKSTSELVSHPNHQVTTPEGLRAEATQIVHQAAADGYIPCARSMVLDLGPNSEMIDVDTLQVLMGKTHGFYLVRN